MSTWFDIGFTSHDVHNLTPADSYDMCRKGERYQTSDIGQKMNQKDIILILIVVLIAVIIAAFTGIKTKDLNNLAVYTEVKTQSDVCPPFYLYDENDNIIDPVNGKNADKPYSPKQTCGKCHDYDKITQGFHFQQGKDELAREIFTERYQWVSSPGNYGGTWCSPAPLYRYLSPKENDTERTIDMTSFSFITAGCGQCHPGGGPLEYDRKGFRYDEYMLEMGYESGGNNDLDGDYYQARWSETGVLEADCMICHQPEYNNNTRKEQLAALNFRWAPSAASGLAEVTGSVDKNIPIKISYDVSKFDSEGKISPRIIREPRNEACLFCHAQPGWKKRGANFDARSDIHLAAGLKCVDCHPAGSRALDSRINEREMHQFSKGDDPGGNVRNDLDNTVIDCNYCHTNGYMGAPVAKHKWLPDLHLDYISCQACHITEKYVKAAQVQAGDVFNPGTKIPSKGKHLWVFYGPNMKYYNHYGNMAMMGFDDKPTDMYKPILADYKGIIRPVNRVHSAWPGIEVKGEKGLMQPKMGDIYKMWEDHHKDTAKYPELSLITDDNNDEVIEVNRPEEIDALISAVTTMLNSTKYPMEGKRVVWAMNERIYTSDTDYYTIGKEEWEASPYANTHTYNHEVKPAKAGLGINGCTDCHSYSSDFFYGQVLKYPFDENSIPVMESQYKRLDMGGLMVGISVFREQFVKSFEYTAIIFLLAAIFLSAAFYVNKKQKFLRINPNHLLILYGILFAGIALIFLKPDVKSYVLPDRLTLEAYHFVITVIALIAGAYTWIRMKKENTSGTFLGKLQAVFLILAVVSGILMMINFDLIYQIIRIAYTIFDISVVLSVLISIVYFINYQFSVIKPETGK